MNKPFLDFAGSRTAAAGHSSGQSAAAGAPAASAAPQRGVSPAATRPARRPAPAGSAQEARRNGSGHALMIGVFALSALVGGGVAGLFLAMQDSVGTMPEDPAGSAAISIITPAPRVAASATPRGESPATPAASAQTAAAKSQDRIATAPATTPPDAPAVKPPAAAAATPPQQKEAAATPPPEELQQLTEQVVSALGALGRAERQGTAEETAAGTDRLRESLAELVNAALARGKSDAEIRSLLSEALDNAGEVPALLRNASGKIDVQRLLASIMPSIRADAMPMSRDERDYFEQLAAEADTTTTAGTTPATPPAARKDRARTRAASRFFVRNGKRYTIIRPGDTLSDIAYAAYGDVLAYSAILRANRGRISVRNLKPGTRILIPDIATTRKNRRRKTRRQGTLQTPAAGERTTAAAQQDRAAILPEGARAQPAGERAVKITNFGPAGQHRPMLLPGLAPSSRPSTAN